MNFLEEGYLLKKKYRLREAILDTEFSNIYLGEFDKKDVIIKECFPSKLVLRDENNYVFTYKNTDKFNLIKKNYIKEGTLLYNFLSNKNIVNIIEILELNNTIYLILECIEGITLEHYIKNEEFNENDIVTIFMQILDTVENIHEEQILHRDLKPSNIFIDKNKNIKIIDFGTAIFKNEKNGDYLNISSGYSPLEMYSLKTTTTETVDTYELCALLYFMLNKQKPMDALNRFYYPELIYEDNISTYLKKIIEKGLSLNKKERYQNIEELRSDIEKGSGDN